MAFGPGSYSSKKTKASRIKKSSGKKKDQQKRRKKNGKPD
jgi:hypothetical protein